jgi:hypothetical protein
MGFHGKRLAPRQGRKTQHVKKATGKNRERTEKTKKIWKPNQIPSEQTVLAVEAREGKPRNRSCH